MHTGCGVQTIRDEEIPFVDKKIAYVLLWFPKPSETFIFREVMNLWKMGLDIRVFTLYGEITQKLSPEMVEASKKVQRLGIPFLWRLPGDISYWHKRKPQLTSELFRTIPLRRWKSIEFGGENIFGFLAGFTLSRLFEENGIRHVHAPWAMGPATAAWVSSRLIGIPFSFTGRAGDIYPQDGALGEKIAGARFVISENKTNVPYMAQYAPGSESKIFPIYNGIPLESHATAPVPMKPPYRILALGRFARIKAFDDLLHAAKILRDRKVPFHLNLVGDGPRKLQLLYLAKRLGITDVLSFPGFVPYNKVSDLFMQADMFVMSSAVHSTGDRDGLPTVIMEALAHRVPVVSTDVCGIPEVIRNGETGFLVPQKNPPELARAMGEMLKDRERAIQMAEAGRQLVLHEFDPQRTHKQVYDLLVGSLESGR
jgi:glycosyltransferase involved in cell wall biosynthesis